MLIGHEFNLSALVIGAGDTDSPGLGIRLAEIRGQGNRAGAGDSGKRSRSAQKTPRTTYADFILGVVDGRIKVVRKTLVIRGLPELILCRLIDVLNGAHNSLSAGQLTTERDYGRS